MQLQLASVSIGKEIDFLHIFKQFFNKINKLCYNSFTGWINMDVISMIDIPSNLEV
jgi:hypothetical protein